MNTTPFQQGERAAFDGYSRMANPFAPGSKDTFEWLRGFNAECDSESSRDDSAPGDNA